MVLLWSAVWSHGIYTNGSGVVGNLVWLLEDTAIVMKHDCTLRIYHDSIVHQMLTLTYVCTRAETLLMYVCNAKVADIVACYSASNSSRHHGMDTWRKCFYNNYII